MLPVLRQAVILLPQICILSFHEGGLQSILPAVFSSHLMRESQVPYLPCLRLFLLQKYALFPVPFYKNRFFPRDSKKPIIPIITIPIPVTLTIVRNSTLVGFFVTASTRLASIEKVFSLVINW